MSTYAPPSKLSGSPQRRSRPAVDVRLVRDIRAASPARGHDPMHSISLRSNVLTMVMPSLGCSLME